jgi:hypothetical protein
MTAPTAGAYLWLFNGPKMLDHELDLPALEIRYRSTGILCITSRYHAGLVAVHRRLHCDDIAVRTACRATQETVALDAYDIVGGLVENLEGCTIHPYDRVLRIVDNYEVIYFIQDHVEQNIGESLFFYFTTV